MGVHYIGHKLASLCGVFWVALAMFGNLFYYPRPSSEMNDLYPKRQMGVSGGPNFGNRKALKVDGPYTV
jgi:hypothetical protein